ncbi:MAG TPA: hypothetical protein VGH87_08670 [Polyangiaceae bacterium]|jgi:hypothetical protein
MKAIAYCAVLVLAGCAHQVHVAKHPPPPRMSPATSSAVVTGEPRATDGEDPAAVQTTGAEIRSQETRPAPAPEPRDDHH